MIIDITEIPVFYINLEHEVGKAQRVESLLSQYEFKDINRFDAVYDDSKNIGCNISHKLLLEKIIEENIYPSIVLEDDIGVKTFRKNIFVPKNADAMFFGISKFGYFPNINLNKFWSQQILEASNIKKDYHRTHNMLSSHALLRLNKEYDLACISQMQKVIDDPEKYITNDVAVAMIHRKYHIYALNDPVFYQADPRTEKYTNFVLSDHKQVIRLP